MGEFERVLERDIEKKMVGGIKAIGGRAYKWVSPGNDGVPDRIVVLPGGKVIFVELKTAKGKLSPIQRRQCQRLRDLGCDVRVLYGDKPMEAFVGECREEVGA